jgi:hypothetical protein
VLPVAGTAAAIGLGGCAVGGQKPAVGAHSETQVQQQVQQFADSLPDGGGKGPKIIKAGSAEDPNVRAAGPVAVAVERRRGAPAELVPEGVVMRWPAVGVEGGAEASAELSRLAALAGGGAGMPGAEEAVGGIVGLKAGRAAQAGGGEEVRGVGMEWSRPAGETVGAAAAPAAAAAVEPTYEQALAVVRKRAAGRGIEGALAMALLDGPQGAADLSGLEATDQQVVGDLLGALDKMADIAPGATLADRAGPLIEAAKKWASTADLSLPKLVLASRVDSFGVYTKVEPKFEAGRRHSVIIYCEVANFASEKDKDGWYETRLAQQESLITEDGLLVWRPSAEEVEDRSLNQRKDFYMVKKLTLPETLAAGHYILRMSVTDRTSDKRAMVKLPVEITEN